MWYVQGSHSLALRQQLGASWLVAASLRSYGGSLVEAAALAVYSSPGGKTALRLGVVEKLSSRDYFYDPAFTASDRDPHNPLLRLYLGPLAPYSQLMVDADRALFAGMRLGGAVWLRRLTDTRDQGPFDTSFADYRVHLQFPAVRHTEALLEYHNRQSFRANSTAPSLFGDVTAAGETSDQDLSAELAGLFARGRVRLSGGVYYRRVSLQDQFEMISGAHQAGWLAGASVKLDEHSRLHFDYTLDNDFLVYRPAIANSRVLRLGILWRL
jgi:hypothetical protein